MNQNTWISWITTGIGLAGSAAVTKGWMDSNTATSIAGAAGVLVPLVWGFFIHSNTSVVQAAGSIPGVRPVEVTSDAPLELQRLAADDAVPSVIAASPAPASGYSSSQRR